MKVISGECENCKDEALLYLLINKVTKKIKRYCYRCRERARRTV
jgi:hypothetical protein